MQRRKIVISLTGPWGSDNSSTYVRACIEFSPSYPDSAVPSLSLERTAGLSEDIIGKIGLEISEIADSFLTRQRSSLEAILRYLLGEQNLAESLLSLRKQTQCVDLDTALDVDFSSSDEDDEVLEKQVGPRVDEMEASDSMIAQSRAQNNPPLPKACGALWADNGRLVCFFPPKLDQDSSLFGLELRSGERFSRNRRSIFEGFGQLGKISNRKKQTTSRLRTIESGHSDSDEYVSSSSGSSSASDGIRLSRHHLLPSMAWRGDATEAYPYLSLNESQRSSNGAEKSRSTSSKGGNFVSIYDFRELLPSKQYLAERYVLGHGSNGYSRNAEIAQQLGDSDLADVWSFIGLLLQDHVPLEIIDGFGNLDDARDIDNSIGDLILSVARRALSKLKSEDSVTNLSFDRLENQGLLAGPGLTKWCHHPLARGRVIDAL